MLVGQVILQKWDSRACGVLWVQILASSQTKRSDGLSKSQTRRKVWRKYLKKRTLKQQYRMEGTTRLTKVARGFRQWEGVWLGQWSRVIVRVRSDTATGMLCGFYLGLKTSVDVLFWQHCPRHQDLLEPLEKATTLRLIPGISKRKCNQLATTMLALMFALEAPVPCKSKPEVRFISQSVNAPR